MDWPGDSTKETQTVLQVPNLRTGERVPFQRVRFQAETLGAGTEPQLNREAGEDMVPKQADEEQEKLAEAGEPDPKQQQFRYE